MRSIVAIIKQGGVKLGPSETIMPDPILVGRNADKLRELCAAGRASRRSPPTSIRCWAIPQYQIYFDAQTTGRRAEGVRKAVAAGKHVYCEKPTAVDTKTALELYQVATKAGREERRGPGQAVAARHDEAAPAEGEDFFGKILSVRGEFGYWVFEGDTVPAQRPSWNYRKEDDGGIIVDMLCHWRYVLDNLFGNVKAVSCLGATHIPERIDEQGKKYKCTADDAAYATFELEGGVIAHFNSSWVDPRPPRRPADRAGRRHPRLRGGRPARLLDPALRRHPAPHLEPRRRRSRSTSSTAGPSCPSRRPTTTPSRSSGSCSCATWSRTSPSAGA